MFSFKQYNFRNLNIPLLVIVCTLCSISTFAIKLSGAVNFKRQLFGLILGLCIVAFVALVDYHFICQLIVVWYVAVVGLLALVYIPGIGTDNDTGSRRWVDLKVFQLQPSELAKIGLILALAVLFIRLHDRMEKISTLLIAGIVAAVPTLLVLMQTDLSSSMVMMFVFAMMIFAAGLSYKIIIAILSIVIPTGGFFFWYIQQPFPQFLEQYQINRITGFLHPEENALGTMYQQMNSIQSIATGQIFGKYITEGPSQIRGYNAVDVNESDFIWSVIGEEFGFVGCCVIILLLTFVIITCLITAKKAKDSLGRLIALGISAMFMFQVFANIGVATMILPNTGLPLPFISYGLSSLISSMIAIGLIINISLQQRKR